MFYSAFCILVCSNFVGDIYVGDDGKLHKVQGGADSVLPFSNGDIRSIISGLTQTGSDSFTGSGDWRTTTRNVAVNDTTNYKFGIIIITAEVDSYSCPISGVSFSNINILWGKLNQSPERTHSSFYVGLFTDIVRNVNFTITSNIRASDRQYRVQIYTA